MPRRLLPLVLAASLLACTSKEEQAADQADAYLEATCRFYVEEDCLLNQEEHCGGTLEFESVGDCVAFLTILGASCDFDGAFLDHADDGDACLSQVQDWDCTAEPLCNGSGDFMPDEGACEAISQQINQTCDDGDGDTGF